jgi:hypothetical protein
MNDAEGGQNKRHPGRWLGATLVSIVVAGATAFAVGIGSHEADKVGSSQATLSYSEHETEWACSINAFLPQSSIRHLLAKPPPDSPSVVEKAPGAVAADRGDVQVSIQGESQRTVTLTGIKFNVHRAALPAGGVFEQQCGGPTVGRVIEADLDTSPPHIVATNEDPNEILRGEENGHPLNVPITFPWTVSLTDPLLLYVIAEAKIPCYCTWIAELPWVSGERRGTIKVDNGGKGYTVASGATAGFAYTSGKWLRFTK